MKTRSLQVQRYYWNLERVKNVAIIVSASNVSPTALDEKADILMNGVSSSQQPEKGEKKKFYCILTLDSIDVQ